MVADKNPQVYHAGFLTIEEPNGIVAPRIAVIQLWCSIIEKASVQTEVRRPDGFIPFEGLGILERYAQVLGHEFVHAELQLNDPVYDQMCREQEKERSAFLSSRQ